MRYVVFGTLTMGIVMMLIRLAHLALDQPLPSSGVLSGIAVMGALFGASLGWLTENKGE